MELESIYIDRDVSFSITYQLLSEREDDESISHNEMPTWKEHCTFIERIPYKGWYLIKITYGKLKRSIGSIYISYGNEIGIAIFKKYRRQGYAKQAISALMAMHSSEPFFLANINPANQKSINLFRDVCGFEHIQSTYKFTKEYGDMSEAEYAVLTGKTKK